MTWTLVVWLLSGGFNNPIVLKEYLKEEDCQATLERWVSTPSKAKNSKDGVCVRTR